MILGPTSLPATCTDRFLDNKAKAALNSGALFLHMIAAPFGNVSRIERLAVLHRFLLVLSISYEVHASVRPRR